MRLRSRVKRGLDKALSLGELNANNTIVKRSATLDLQQETVLHSNEPRPVRAPEGPPALEDVVHARGSQTMFEDIRRIALEKLQGLGLSWDKNVEEVRHVYDYLQA